MRGTHSNIADTQVKKKEERGNRMQTAKTEKSYRIPESVDCQNIQCVLREKAVVKYL